jgi:hypothetical protein
MAHNASGNQSENSQSLYIENYDEEYITNGSNLFFYLD